MHVLKAVMLVKKYCVNKFHVIIVTLASDRHTDFVVTMFID